MNNFQKSLLTAALTWAGVVSGNLFWQTIGRTFMWDMSYFLPPAVFSSLALLIAAFWVALIAWAIWRVWKKQ